MAGVADRLVLGLLALQRAAAWSAVKGRVVFPTSWGTGGIHRWISAHQPVEKALIFVGKRWYSGKTISLSTADRCSAPLQQCLWPATVQPQHCSTGAQL